MTQLGMLHQDLLSPRCRPNPLRVQLFWFSVKVTAVCVTLRKTRASPIAAGMGPAEGWGASQMTLAALAG